MECRRNPSPMHVWSLALVLLILVSSGPSMLSAIQSPDPPRGVTQLKAPMSAVKSDQLPEAKKDRLIHQAVRNMWRYISSPDPSQPASSKIEATNEQIAYVGRDGQLWIMGPDGSQQRVIPSELRNIQGPSWSNNNRYLVFLADGVDGRCLYKLELESLARVRLACDLNMSDPPQWSPDDQHILLYGRWIGSGVDRTLVVQSSGGIVQVLAPDMPQNFSATWLKNDTVVLPGEVQPDIWKLHTVRLFTPNNPQPITPEFRCGDECTCGAGDDWLVYPQTSPTGSEIAFLGGYTVGVKNSCVAYYAVYLVDPAGILEPRKIVDVADTSSGLARGGMLRWSPDNHHLAMYAGGSESLIRLNVIDTSTANLNALKGREAGDWYAFDWSPDSNSYFPT